MISTAKITIFIFFYFLLPIFQLNGLNWIWTYWIRPLPQLQRQRQRNEKREGRMHRTNKWPFVQTVIDRINIRVVCICTKSINAARRPNWNVPTVRTLQIIQAIWRVIPKTFIPILNLSIRPTHRSQFALNTIFWQTFKLNFWTGKKNRFFFVMIVS